MSNPPEPDLFSGAAAGRGLAPQRSPSGSNQIQNVLFEFSREPTRFRSCLGTVVGEQRGRETERATETGRETERATERERERDDTAEERYKVRVSCRHREILGSLFFGRLLKSALPGGLALQTARQRKSYLVSGIILDFTSSK